MSIFSLQGGEFKRIPLIGTLLFSAFQLVGIHLFFGWDDNASLSVYDNCGFQVYQTPNRFEYLNMWSPNWIGNAY